MKIKNDVEIFKRISIKKIIYIILFLYFLIIKIKINLSYFINPKVSVFLPIYNKELYLKRSISSIQKQSLRDLEIVAVNDCSNDNSLKILKKLAKKDKRIKIVNNDRNHGLLYSRAMGILNCTGEYVLNLDPDDMFSSIFNLEMLYKKAKEKKIDIIIFKLKKIRTNKINISQFNQIIKKINLNNSFSPMKICNYLITNKFIKKTIILEAYNSFKNKIYKSKWNYHEDNIWSILINNYTKSKILINKFLYLHLLNGDSLMNNRGNILELKNYIYKFEMIKVIYKKRLSKVIINLLFLITKYKIIIKKDLEIKKKIVHIFIDFLFFYKLKKFSFLKHLIKKFIRLIKN